MATVAELQARLSSLERLIDANLAKVAALTREQESIQAQRQKLFAGGDREGAAVLRAQENAIDNEIAGLQGQYQDEAATLRRQIEGEEAKQANASPTQPPPPATASQAAQDDAPKGPNAPQQTEVDENGRIVPPPDTSSSSNAEGPVTSDTGGDTGTNAPLRTAERTQATDGYAQGINIRSEDGGTLSNLRRNPETGELYDASGLPGGVDLTTEPGAAAPSDDAKNNSTTTVQADVNAATNALKIQAKPNPLNDYASYTYSISVYLLSATQYERLLRSKTKKIDGYFLLFQDGGAPVNRGGVKEGMGSSTNVTSGDSGRNPFFPNDYYIDSLTMDTSPLGKATGASHMTATMKLVVNEPGGITLIDNLYSAVANLQQKDGSGKVNYTAADYLAVIRFYGYDADGTPVQIRNNATGAVIEKFVPFKLAAINWSIGTKMVTYEWDCVPQGQLIAGYTARGSIPQDVQLVNTTVGKLIGNDAPYTGTGASSADPGKSTTSDPQTTVDDNGQTVAAPAPPTAQVAPTTKKSIGQGLMGALTEFQEELTKTQKGQSESIFNISDRYFIKFVNGMGYDGKVIPASAIENATITLPNTKVDKKQVAAGKNSDTKDLDPLKQSQDNMSRSFSITAGQMITQVIDLAIRNSSYILGQALVRQDSDGYQVPNPDKRNSPMSWFNIIMNAVPRPGGIDPKRNDYAYDITYTIKPYRLQNFNSKYFAPSRFAGVHKSYPYWFTGQNTAVLEYQETMNALYSITVSGSDPKNSAAAKIREGATSSMRDIAKYNYAVSSGQSTQGSSDTRLNETAANAADYLFSPGDLANSKMKILGDPDWIQQGSLFKEIKVGETQIADSTGFGEDGSISFETGDVLYEIVWQRPEDYDLTTGVADPYSGGYSGNANKQRAPIQSRVYQVVKVISEFRQGRFEQTIEGTLYQFPLPSKKNTIQASGSSVTNDSLDNGRPTAGQGAGSGSAAGGRAGSSNQGGTGSSSTGNQTSATGGRTGLALASRIQNTATTDPRSLLSADGGTAAMLGAQQAGGSQASLRNPGSNTGTGNETDAFEQANADPANIRLAGAVRSSGPPTATDELGNPIPVTEAVNSNVINSPPKLPSALPGQAGLTELQVAQIQAGDYNNYTDPTSATNPSNQEIATDGG